MLKIEKVQIQHFIYRNSYYLLGGELVLVSSVFSCGAVLCLNICTLKLHPYPLPCFIE